jgi:hypothetical protein
MELTEAATLADRLQRRLLQAALRRKLQVSSRGDRLG